MPLRGFASDRRGSAVRWFAYAAAAITVTAAIGAHGLAWIAQAERRPMLAFLPLQEPLAGNRPPAGVDMTATGTIHATPTASSKH